VPKGRARCGLRYTGLSSDHTAGVLEKKDVHALPLQVARYETSALVKASDQRSARRDAMDAQLQQ